RRRRRRRRAAPPGTGRSGAVSSSAGSKTAVMVLCSRTGRPRPTSRGRCRQARARKAEGPEGSIPEDGGSLRARPRKADGGGPEGSAPDDGRRGPTTEGAGQRADDRRWRTKAEDRRWRTKGGGRRAASRGQALADGRPVV